MPLTPVPKATAASWITRLLPLAGALVLVLLVFLGLQTYRKAAQSLALQHNLQHLRLIETVAGSLQNRLVNMQAAFNHYGALIPLPPGRDSAAEKICEEIERSFSTIVSSASIIDLAGAQDLATEKHAHLALTPDSTSQLAEAASKSSSHLLLLRSIRGESVLVFLSPIVRQARAHLAVVVPLERLLTTFHMNDARYDDDYLWILGRDGTLLYHPKHPEMIGNNIFEGRGECDRCHRSFDLEYRMARGETGYGLNDVPQGYEKIVAYAPLDAANLRWSIAVSESLDVTTAPVQEHTRIFTLIAVVLSLVILASSIYIMRANHLRLEAQQQALHLQEERLLQQQLERKQKQLLVSERFATVGRMAAQMAHEIKNPLSSISLNTELLVDELQSNGQEGSPEARQLIDSILSEIDLLTRTIDEYLQFARFPKLQKEQISLAEIVGTLSQLLHEESVSRSIDLQCAIDPSLPRLYADPRLLRQALLNLIRNAFEAVGGEGWVRVEGTAANGEVRLEVADSGPGVAPEHVPMLFEPFFTTKPKGTGLGLPLTRHIVYEHGGAITYEPAEGAGARFVVTLPLADPTPEMPRA